MPPDDAPVVLPYAAMARVQSPPSAKMAMLCSLGAFFGSFGFASGHISTRHVDPAIFCGLSMFGICGIGLGTFTLCKKANRFHRSNANPLAILAIVTGVTGSVLSLAAVPQVVCYRELSPRTMCSTNIRGILQTSLIYANENEGRFPDELEVFLRNGDMTDRQLECGASGLSNYIYSPGLTKQSTPNMVLVMEPLSNHGDGANVGFVEGSVRFVDPGEYQRLLVRHYGVEPRRSYVP